MIKFLMALIMSLTSVMGFYINENNITDYINPDAHSTVNYIVENFDSFIYEYNELSEESEKINASSVERTFDVTYINTLTIVVCIDFNDDTGYMLIGDDYELIAIDLDEDISYVDENDAYYEQDNGFVYYDEELQDFLPYKNYGYDYDIQIDDICSSSVDYIGFSDSSQYIKDTYGKGYSLSESKSLSIDGNNQGYLSLYIIKGDGNGYYSEGNCALTSVYTFLVYLRDEKGYTDICDGCIKINMEEDLLYDVAKEKGYIVNSSNESNLLFYNSRTNEMTLPYLYYKIRQIAIENYGYEINNGCSNNLLIDCLEEFGYEGYKLTWWWGLFKTFSTLQNKIDSGMPIIYSFSSGNEIYGGAHSTIVTGYEIYKKTYKIWFLKFTDTKRVIILDDHHQDSVVYLDYELSYRYFHDYFMYLK